jgi:hypothetical protein
MEKTDRNLYRLAPTNRLSVVASAVVVVASAVVVVALAVVVASSIASATASAPGMADGISVRIPRWVAPGKAYDREQFRKAHDNHRILRSF